jgi:transcriptional regulator with XRE-family HTH domain
MGMASPPQRPVEPSEDDPPAADDPDLLAFGARLRARRKDAGMTQEDLAFAANLHWTYVSQIERGKRNLTYKSIIHLADGLGITPEHLMPASST